MYETYLGGCVNLLTVFTDSQTQLAGKPWFCGRQVCEGVVRQGNAVAAPGHIGLGGGGGLGRGRGRRGGRSFGASHAILSKQLLKLPALAHI